MTRKGKAGTDRSAPERLTGIEKIIERVSSRKMAVRVNGERIDVSVAEALLIKNIETGMSGSPNAQRDALKLIREVEAKRRRMIEEEIEIARRYIAAARRQIAAARAKGLPEPVILPHPDDILIDPETGVRFVGPLNQADLDECRRTGARRDALILQDHYERRATTGRRRPSPGAAASGLLLMASLADQSLPPRLQLTGSGMIDRMHAATQLTQRDLLKRLRALWRETGEDVPRGAAFPVWFTEAAWLERVLDPVADWLRDGMKPDEIDAVVREIAGVAREASQRDERPGCREG